MPMLPKLRKTKRIKPKVVRPPSAFERRHMNRLRDMGCVICGGEPEMHHITSDGSKRITRSWKRVMPLCPDHHRTGGEAVERISQEAFNALHDIDCLAWVDQAWLETVRLGE